MCPTRTYSMEAIKLDYIYTPKGSPQPWAILILLFWWNREEEGEPISYTCHSYAVLLTSAKNPVVRWLPLLIRLNVNLDVWGSTLLMLPNVHIGCWKVTAVDASWYLDHCFALVSRSSCWVGQLGLFRFGPSCMPLATPVRCLWLTESAFLGLL